MGCTWLAFSARNTCPWPVQRMSCISWPVALPTIRPASCALVAEATLPGRHHAALAGQHGLAADTEVDADELLVLLGPPLTGGRLLVGPQRGGHLHRPAGRPEERRTGTARRADPAPGPEPGRTAAAGRSREAPSGPAARSRGCGRCLLAVTGRHGSRLTGRLLSVPRRRTGRTGRLDVRSGARRWHGAARRGVQRGDDGRRGVHRGRGGRRRESLRGGLRRGGRSRGAERGGAVAWAGGAKDGAAVACGSCAAGCSSATSPPKFLSSASRPPSKPCHGGEPPDVLQVEVAQHHGTLGGETRAH